MTVRIDLTNQQFGLWTVLGPAPDKAGRPHWRCQCTCGRIKSVNGSNLRMGNSTACGCTKPGPKPTHGMTKHPMYQLWANMLKRCRNPNRLCFPRYGGRGIKVCKRWHDFANFYADMGERPDGLTLDRIDNNGDYAPGNVRWATWIEQAANKRQRSRSRKPEAT